MAVKQATVAQEELQWNQLPRDWPLILKEDWQNKTNGINEVAEVANEANRTANNEVDRNKEQDYAIELNRNNIKEVSSNLSRLSSTVNENSSNIKDNKEGIYKNKQASKDNATNLSDHKAETTAHGVNGKNVGTEDYAQELTGGVVLLASSLGEITTSFTPVADAPDSYDKSHMQSVVNAVNSLGSKQGDIITLLNQVISTQVTAKQRAQNADVSDN